MLRAAVKLITLTPLGEVAEWRVNCPTVRPRIPACHLRVQIPVDNPDIMGRAFVVQVLLVRVEGILDRIVRARKSGLYCGRSLATTKINSK